MCLLYINFNVNIIKDLNEAFDFQLNLIKDKEAEVVSQEERDKAMINWNSCDCPNVKEPSYPV